MEVHDGFLEGGEVVVVDEDRLRLGALEDGYRLAGLFDFLEDVGGVMAEFGNGYSVHSVVVVTFKCTFVNMVGNTDVFQVLEGRIEQNAKVKKQNDK